LHRTFPRPGDERRGERRKHQGRSKDSPNRPQEFRGERHTPASKGKGWGEGVELKNTSQKKEEIASSNTNPLTKRNQSKEEWGKKEENPKKIICQKTKPGEKKPRIVILKRHWCGGWWGGKRR